MKNKQSYRVDSFDSRELRKEWFAITETTGVAKKRFEIQESYFKLLDNSFELFKKHLNEIMPEHVAKPLEVAKTTKVIPIKHSYKKGEKHIKPDLNIATAEIKTIEEEATLENLNKYITQALDISITAKEGLLEMSKVFKEYLESAEGKKDYDVLGKLLDNMDTMYMNRDKFSRRSETKEAKAMFSNTLHSYSNFLNVSKLDDDASLESSFRGMEWFNALNELMNVFYSVINKYYAEMITKYNPQDEDGKQFNKALNLMIEGNKVLAGYRWHIQEINANTLHVIYILTKIQNFKSKMLTVQALFMEDLLDPKNNE